MVRAVIRRVPPRFQWLAGTLALLTTAWVCMYGKLWCYERVPAHRFTSRAMLEGSLQLRSLVSLARPDEQVYGGAVYTNWGFGVPLLQLPFHAFASVTGLLHGFFPDRMIYFLYLSAAVPLLWASFDRFLALKSPLTASPAQRRAASWAITWLVLNWVLFPYMSTRFIVYEETCAYFTICELLALGAYVFSLSSRTAGPVVAMGAAAGIALLVRPTGLVYLGVWGSLVAVGRRTRGTLLFVAVAAPFVAFFLYSNWVRTGAVMGLGFANSNPSTEYHVLVQRFGSICANAPVHTLEVAASMFSAFFLYIWRIPSSGWLRACHFGGFEERDGTREPYFGPAVLVLLIALLIGLARRRERRLWLFIPYAAMAALFAAFVRQGWGFNWRYEGDFWPLLVLAVVQYVLTLEPPALKPLGDRTIKIFFWAGFVFLARFLVPWEWSSGGPHGDGRADIYTTKYAPRMAQEFRASHAGVDPAMPSRLACGDPIQGPYKNGLGWRDGCLVGPATNVYLGVRPKGGNHYALRLQTEGPATPDVSVFVNGKVYNAQRRGDGYDADVVIDYASLTSPVVIATVLWTRDAEPPPVRLLSVELV
jgi:hypothetical protein